MTENKFTPGELTAKVPAGYELKWPHGGHSLLMKTGDHDGPAWKVLCNAHGTLHDAKSAKEAESLGAKAVRATWCKTEILAARRAATAAARAEAAK